MNNINFPAGILQPPFYDIKMDDAVNFGGIGMVIGHELTHGFDDEGRQFDAQGNLNDWWTPEDAKAFDQREACIVQEYSSFSPGRGVHLNGKLTLGENTADNGGPRLALMALLDSHRRPTAAQGRRLHARAALFLSFGQVWCANERPEAVAPAGARPIPTPRPNSASTASSATCRSSRRPSPAKPASPWSAPTPAGSGRPGIGGRGSGIRVAWPPPSGRFDPVAGGLL